MINWTSESSKKKLEQLEQLEHLSFTNHLKG